MSYFSNRMNRNQRIKRRIVQKVRKERLIPNRAVLALDEEDPINKLFVSEYLKDMNGGAAARRLGLATPEQTGARLLRKYAVRMMIDEEIRPHVEKNLVTVRAVVAEIAKLAFANIEDYGFIDDDGHFGLNLSETPRHRMAAIGTVETECDIVRRTGSSPRARKVEEPEEQTEIARKRMRIHLYDKNRALELLGKYLKIFGMEAMPLGGAGGRPPVLNIKFVKAEKK